MMGWVGCVQPHRGGGQRPAGGPSGRPPAAGSGQGGVFVGGGRRRRCGDGGAGVGAACKQSPRFHCLPHIAPWRHSCTATGMFPLLTSCCTPAHAQRAVYSNTGTHPLTPTHPHPTPAEQVFWGVMEHGGHEAVTGSKLSFNMRVHYERCLLDFETFQASWACTRPAAAAGVGCPGCCARYPVTRSRTRLCARTHTHAPAPRLSRRPPPSCAASGARAGWGCWRPGSRGATLNPKP